MNKLQPCGKDDWVCECAQCDEYWEWMADQEIKDIGGLQTTKEYDDELENSLSETFKIDGW